MKPGARMPPPGPAAETLGDIALVPREAMLHDHAVLYEKEGTLDAFQGV